MLYESGLPEASFYELLERIDRDLAETAREAGCWRCGGVLHRALYGRKPRGGPRELGAGYEKRWSFCCAVRDCRKRRTPPSVRFLGRRVFLGAVVVLVTALRHGVTPKRGARLRELVGVSLRTVKRWRRWWQDTFTQGPFWKQVKGRFAPAAEAARLPASLLERFSGEGELARLAACLAFLSPISTTSSAQRAG